MAWQLRHKHVGDLMLFLLRRRQRFRVVGTSMLPLLKPGEEVLIAPVKRKAEAIALKPGDLVVARHPFQPTLRLIKRVITVRDDGTYLLMGDNPEAGMSTDSRSFGAVSPSHILGRVICRLP